MKTQRENNQTDAADYVLGWLLFFSIIGIVIGFFTGWERLEKVFVFMGTLVVSVYLLREREE